MASFLEELKEQRWDDHRFYHHSRINQALHLVSALSFLCTYVLLFTSPVAGALLGWIFAMCIRQVGHFFFEPKGFDDVNQATHAYKEKVKVGYNLRRKVVLLSIWAASPLVLYFDPTLFGIFQRHLGRTEFLQHMSQLWIVFAGCALLFRTFHLFYLRGVQTGVVWLTKILTDPFHDVIIYHKAPLYLLRGEMMDPMTSVQYEQHA